MGDPNGAQKAFAGRMVRVTLERWDEREFEVVERADSVAVVAVDGDDGVTLVRQFRPPARAELLELPAGTVDDDEEPLATAKRELAEETGLRGGRWRAGPVVYSTPGFCTERIHFFFAEGLERGEPAETDGEAVDVVRWPVAEVAARLDEITDGKTLAGLLAYLRERL